MILGARVYQFKNSVVPTPTTQDNSSLMKFSRTFITVNSVLSSALGLIPTVSIAQIVPDRSLPVNSMVTPNGNSFTLEGGTLAGGNLFHSFSDFSVPTGSEAFFNNALSIENIITRVTGGNTSSIDGLIRANGTANLFVFNPAGILLGPNARLDIGGSFLASSAERLLFEDGTAYSATDTQVPPLLSINVPMGLQLGAQPGTIQVQGTGHRLTTAIPAVTPVRFVETVGGLEVKTGQTLALVGGDVVFQGGIVTAPGGHVELGSVRETTVTLASTPQGFMLEYPGGANFGNIAFSQRSLANAGGVKAGSIRVSGGQIRFDDSSLLWVQNLGTQPAGRIEVTASELFSVDNSNRALHDRKLASGVLSEAMNLGSGSDIWVSTPQLIISGGGLILGSTFGAGRGGNVTVDSTVVRVSGMLPLEFFGASRIGSQTASSGNAGNVSVVAGDLFVLNRGSVASLTSGQGTTGEVRVNAERIELAQPLSNIGSLTTGVGSANQILLKTRTLQVRDGGIISSSSVSAGNSGRIAIEATESVEVVHSPGSSSPTQIRSAVLMPTAHMQRNFKLSALPTGRAGTIEIHTPAIRLSAGAQISVQNEGTGNAGNIKLNADRMVLDGDSRMTASTTSGEGGNLLARVQHLQLRDASSLDTESYGTGNGGNITIDAKTITLLGNSRLNANAIEGAGGNIQITTQGWFAFPQSSITASSLFGVDGVVKIVNPDVDPNSGLVNFSQEVVDPNDRVVAGCQWTAGSQFVASGRGGIPTNPSRPVSSHRAWSDVRDLSEFRQDRVATVPQRLATREPLTQANSWVRHEDGTIELIARSVPVEPRWGFPDNCDRF